MRRGILFGVPRSGTSWAGQILNSAPGVQYRFQPLHAYSFAPSLAADATAEDVADYFRLLLATHEPYVTQRDGHTLGGRAPSFAKGLPTHVVFKEVHDADACRNAAVVDAELTLLGLVRDPLDVLTSWVNAGREFDPSWRIEDEWWQARRKNAEYRGNCYGLAAWMATTTSLLALSGEHPGRVGVLRYEHLREDPRGGAARLLAFFGVPWSPATARFVAQSTSTDDPSEYGVYRSAAPRGPGTARRALPPDVTDAVVERVRAAGLGCFLRAR